MTLIKASWLKLLLERETLPRTSTKVERLVKLYNSKLTPNEKDKAEAFLGVDAGAVPYVWMLGDPSFVDNFALLEHSGLPARLDTLNLH